MRKIIHTVLAVLLVAAAAEAGTGAVRNVTIRNGSHQAKTQTDTTRSGDQTGSEANALRSGAMTEDIYVEIKAHEAAFLAASFMKSQDMQMDTAEAQQAALQFAQAKQNDFNAVKRTLLARYGVQEKDFDAYETKLNGESWNQVNTDVNAKDIDLTNLKLDEANSGMNEKARRLAERIAARAQEIQNEQLYK
jgi:hypothetical protein